MEHLLPALPFASDALPPHMSLEVFEIHHGKLHNAYVVNLNKRQKGTEFESMSLDDIVRSSSGDIYDKKALLTVDVWEHANYIDHRNLRPQYVETFLASLVNWGFAQRNFT